jgi:hypothetical protein
MLVLMLCAALAAVVSCLDIPIGRGLRRALVEAPAKALSRLTPGQIALALIMTAAGVLVALMFEAEGLRLLGMALPEGLAWIAAFDIATFLDLFAAAAMVAAAARLRGLRDTARLILARTRGRLTRLLDVPRRARRHRRVRRPSARPGRTDDGGDWPAFGSLVFTRPLALGA